MELTEQYFQLAAEYSIKGVTEAIQHEAGGHSSGKEDFAFFNPHIYNTDSKGNFVFQRRVHFLSENKCEIIAYAANVLISCFHVSTFYVGKKNFNFKCFIPF